MSEYIADQSWPDEAERLRELERALDVHTQRYLRALGLSAGMRCLEIGAGSGSVARFMAEVAGESGEIVATDLDITLLTALAQQYPYLFVRCENIVESIPQPPASFDLAHARLVLGHVPHPERALANVYQALKPGGAVLIEDVDFFWRELGTQPIAPATATEPYFRVWSAVVDRMEQRGYAVYWGRRLAAALRAAGFESVAGEAVALIGSRSLQCAMRLTIARFGSALVREGKLDEGELAACLRVLDDPATIFTGSPMFSVWGRRPHSS